MRSKMPAGMSAGRHDVMIVTLL